MCVARSLNPQELRTFVPETRNVDRFGLIATTEKNAKKGKADVLPCIYAYVFSPSC